MITTRMAAAFAAGGLAVGILAGSAGTIVLHEATSPNAGDSAAHMSQMGSMMSMMNGAGGMMNGAGGMGPAASALPETMQPHHMTSSPVPTR